MRVLTYSVMPLFPTDYGGAVRICNIAAELQKKGIETVTVSPRPDDRVKFPSDNSFVYYDSIVQNFATKHKSAEKLKYVSWFFLFVANLLLLHKTLKRQGDIQILQSEYIYSAPPLIILKKIYGLPLVLVEHNIESELAYNITGNKLLYKVMFAIERVILHSSDQVVCMSVKDREKLITQFGVSPDRLSVIPNAATIGGPADFDEIARIRKELKIGEQDKIVLFMGTLEYIPNIKGIEIIEKYIYPQVKTSVPSIKFMIVGKGREKRIEGDFIYTGKVEETRPYICMCDVAICPLTLGSGTRLKILEYMACGKPVVSTTVGAEGIEVTDGKDIFIEDDWNGFAKRTSELLTDRRLSEKIGSGGKMLIHDKYTWDRCTDELIVIYNDIMNK